MIYFIFWVVFLLLAIVAVPLAMMLDGKSRQRVAYGGAYDESVGDEAMDDGAVGDDGLQPLDDDGFGAAEAVDDFGAEPIGGDDDFGGADFGGDDFSAFEEELK
ncbi:MAG: hypothetical protein WBD20_14570 [Pirellulaceae bacterium]